MLSIYIAEDNPILLQGLERALAANGYAVTAAENGEAMLRLLDEAPLPDMLLLDVMMPHVSGVEVLAAARANPRTAHIPVMLITAAAEEVVPAHVLDLHDVEVLTKPFRLKELLEKVGMYASGQVGTVAPSAPRSAGR
jgi:CheY-like chemotaxis protein